MLDLGFRVIYNRPILSGGRHEAYHVCVAPPDGGCPQPNLADVALCQGFPLCDFAFAAEPIDLSDSKDSGGDTAALLLETVLNRDDLTVTLRFEAAIWQYIVVQLTRLSC
eukprot:m.186404 g.186404  ORF g.186404 m.186404 type:complete len:110 (+) comp15050_c0_seq5:629-958(+)